MAWSVTEADGAGAVSVILPVRLPCPMDCPATLYSPNWSIKLLVRTKSKNWFICARILADGSCCQLVPQNQLGSGGRCERLRLGFVKWDNSDGVDWRMRRRLSRLLVFFHEQLTFCQFCALGNRTHGEPSSYLL